MAKDENEKKRKKDVKNEKKKKKKKKDKKDKKDKKKKKKKKKDRKADRMDERDKSIHATSAATLPPVSLAPGSVAISSDDYFRLSINFRLWLKQDLGIDFEDLDSTDARHRFNSFVSSWNAGKLRSTIYDPKKSDLQAFQRTKHTWQVKLSGDERLALSSLRDRVADANNLGSSSVNGHKRLNAAISGSHGDNSSTSYERPQKLARTGAATSKRAEILRKKQQADALEDARMEAFKKAMGLS